MMLKVTDVEYMGNYALLCRFNNGLQRYVDMEPLLKYPMYAELKDKEQFRQFGLDGTGSRLRSHYCMTGTRYVSHGVFAKE